MKNLLYAIGLALTLIAASCGEDQQPATVVNAVAAYIHVSSDIHENGDVIDPLTIARADEPSEPAGFITGVRSTSRREAADGVWGWEIIFQRDMTEAQRLNLESRATTLGLTVIWLNPEDEWPYCAGEQDCQLVKESGNFP